MNNLAYCSCMHMHFDHCGIFDVNIGISMTDVIIKNVSTDSTRGVSCLFEKKLKLLYLIYI